MLVWPPSVLGNSPGTSLDWADFKRDGGHCITTEEEAEDRRRQMNYLRYHDDSDLVI
jgi:hypothetical protein